MRAEHIAWPGQAQSAVMVTFNLDAEYLLSAFHPDAKTEGTSFAGIVDGSIALRVRRVLGVLAERGIKSTFFVPGAVAEKRGDLVAEIADAGHEIGIRGYKNENLALLPEEEQREIIAKTVSAVEKAAGRAPRGFRMPEGEISKATLRIVRDAGLTYSSSLSDADNPYEIDLGGSSILEIPFHWALYDMPYFLFNFWPTAPFGQDRIACFRKVLTNWEWEYDAFHEEGLCCVLQFEPHTIGEPAHIFILEKILDYIIEKGGVWFAAGSEMENHIRAAKESA